MNSIYELERKYEDCIDDPNTIAVLLNDDIRKYVIENAHPHFLYSIASSSSSELKDFYFNEDTVELFDNFDQFHLNLFRPYYPNKIQLFDKIEFLKYCCTSNNLPVIIKYIYEEISINRDNLDIVNALNNALLKIINYLKLNFSDNFKLIEEFMSHISHDLRLKTFDCIIDDLVLFEKNNKESDSNIDRILLHYFYSCDSFDFKDIEKVINKFNNSPNIIYSYSLIRALLGSKCNDLMELDKLRKYVFNLKIKNIFLSDFNYKLFDKLYLEFNDIIDYYLDDCGIESLEKNHGFDRLFYCSIPFDSLISSKVFLNILSKREDYLFDRHISYLINKLKDESIFIILDYYIDINDYTHFYRLFNKISSKNQLEYFKNNIIKITSINNIELYKGCKREVYELINIRYDISKCIYSAEDLNNFLLNSSEYSLEQIKLIFSNKDNIINIINNSKFCDIFANVFKLNIDYLNKIYMSEEVVSLLRNSGKLDRIISIFNNFDSSFDFTMFFLNTNSLNSIGEVIFKKYDKNDKIKYSSYFSYPMIFTFDEPYYNFFKYVPKLKSKDLLFKVLDYYLTNSKYQSSFYLLRKELDEDTLKEYYESRRELITKLVNDDTNNNLCLLLGNLPISILDKEFFKEREKYALYCEDYMYNRLFEKAYNGEYRLSNEILNDERFIEKFIGRRDCSNELKLVTDDEMIIEKLSNKVVLYTRMKKNIIQRLNDSPMEFETLIDIFINSGINVFENEFLKDMIDVIFYNKRINEVCVKYKNVNIEAVKLKIYKDMILNSKNSFVSSITNPLEKEAINMEYELDGEKVIIPTIIYDGDDFVFLVRTMRTGGHINSSNSDNRLECFSTITEKNRSMYHGNLRVKFGYINVPIDNIVQINSFDAISKSSLENKYREAYIKLPEWISMDELNKRTLNNESYNEIRINGNPIPAYTISFDEPNINTIRYSHEHGVSMVKILRKEYPNSIENCEDVYKDWQ